MTKSEAVSRRTTRSSAKQTTATKRSGRSVLGDVSVNSRVTRSSREKGGQKIQSAVGGQVRRSTRKSGDSKQLNDTTKKEAIAKSGASRKSASRRSDPKRPSSTKASQKATTTVLASGSDKNKTSRRKRKIDDEETESVKKTAEKDAAEAVAKGKKRARKSDDGKETARNNDETAVATRGRSTKRTSHETTRSNSFKSQTEDLDESEPKVKIRSVRETAAIGGPRTRSISAKPRPDGSNSSVEVREGTTAAAKNTRSRSSKANTEGSDSVDALAARRTRSERHATTKSISQTRSKSTSRSRRVVKQDPTPSKSLCVDFLENTDYGLDRDPDQDYFDPSKYTFGVADHDKPRRHDVLEVSDYVTDIYQRLFYAENQTRPRTYLQNQPHLNAMMRAILVDWIVEVHMKFRLSPPTLYLCVNIIDRYLNLASVERENLQLVGVTALLLACKYEEIYPPEVRDCVYITDRAYTRQDVLNMEQEIVKRLEFKMTVPTGHPFLQRFLTITGASETACMAANYYMERLLQEHEMLEFRPSLVAAAVVCLALNNPEIREFDDANGPNPGIPSLLLTHTGFTSAEICEVAKKISTHVAREVTTQSGRDLIAVKRKYEANKFQQVAIRFSDPTVEDIMNEDE